jgi:hypothetical protein
MTGFFLNIKILFLLVIFNFNRELAFKKCDVIIVHKRVNQEWYLGEHHGFCGLFPASFVHFLDNKTDGKYEIQKLKSKLLSMEGLAEAKFDFKAKTKDELELRKVRINK